MKYTILTLCLCCSLAQAQTYIERAISYDIPTGVVDAEPLPGGDILLATFAYPSTYDSAVAMLVKVDSNLEVRWAKRYKAFTKDDMSSLTTLQDGNILLGGTMRQQFSNQVGGSIYKIDTAGNVIWHKAYSASYDDRVLDVFEEADSSLMIFIRHGVTNQPTKILHANSNGDLLSSTTYFNGSRGVFAEAVTSDQNGDYYMSGMLYNLTTTRLDLFVCLVNGSGMQWYKLFEFGRSISSYGISLTTDGNLMVAGHIQDTNTFNANNLFLMKLDLQGNELWTTEYAQPDPYTESLWGMLPRSNGEMILFGGAGTATGRDGLIFKVDASGNLMWTKGYHHYPIQTGYLAKVLPNDRLFLTMSTSTDSVLLLTASMTGETACSGISKTLVTSTLTVSSSSPSITSSTPNITPNTPVITVSPASIAERTMCSGTVGLPAPALLDDVRLYPVPSRDWLYIDLPSNWQQRKVTLQVADVCGRMLQTEVLSQQGRIQLGVSQLQSGIYWVEIISGEQRVTRKFVKL